MNSMNKVTKRQQERNRVHSAYSQSPVKQVRMKLLDLWSRVMPS